VLIIRTVCISGYGKKLKKHNGIIAVESGDDGEGNRDKHTISPLDIDLLMLSGEHDITTGALRLLLSSGVDVAVLDSFGNPAGYLLPCGKSKLIERFEGQKSLGTKRRLAIARMVCTASLTNKVSLLRSVSKNIELCFDEEIGNILSSAGNIENCNDAGSLMGVEGYSTNEYFSALRKVIPEEFGFTGRERMPPCDPVNALFGYGYGILYSVVRRAIVKAGLSPYYGVLHSSYKNQEALVYDLIEEFRQPVVDRVILTLISRKQVSPVDFKLTDKGCMMNGYFKKQYADHILTRLEKEYTYEKRKLNFYEIIESQAQKMEKAVFENEPYKPFIYR
jgi:CRISPR-associated protein Cas1